MRIVTHGEMREIEQRTKEDFLFDENLIIENVGRVGAEYLEQWIRNNQYYSEVLFLVGKGHNGADSMSIARHLTNSGIRCRAFLLFPKEEWKEELHIQINRAQRYGVIINFIDKLAAVESYFSQMGPLLVVDGLFGTGIQLPLPQFIYQLIDFINESAQTVVSIDIPSGVDGDSGHIQGNAIMADITLVLAHPKLGHYVDQGPRHSGQIEILSVGFPQSFHTEGDKFLLSPKHMVGLLEKRDKFSDKKDFGHSLILGGSHGLTGAPILASRAALQVGSGLVTVATWESQYSEMMARLTPEIMTGYIPLDAQKWGRIIKDLNKYSAIVVGPGLARSTRARKLVLEILNNYDGPLILDADAINVLNYQEDQSLLKLRAAPTILTPHYGEFSRFSGVDYLAVAHEPVTHLKQLVETINCTILLKGPCSYLGCTDGNIYFNYSPNDGMATGGMGDVLAGILAGLLAQSSSLHKSTDLSLKYNLFNKNVAFAIYLHSLAGKVAAKNYGERAMNASSLIDSLSQAFLDLENHIIGMEKSGG